jgi:steroid delta-isomerase-like uncharacterized protein
MTVRVVLGLFFLAAALSPVFAEHQTAAGGQGPTASALQARKELILRLYLDGYMRQDPDVIDAVYAEEYVRHDSGQTEKATRQQQHDLARMLRQAFPDIQARVDFVTAEDDKVVARWTMWGTETGQGPFGPPSGRPFRFSGINVYRFEGGKVVELWNHRDDLHWFQQLGLVPAELKRQAAAEPAGAPAQPRGEGLVLEPEGGEPLIWCDAPELRANIKISPGNTAGHAPFAVGTAELTGANTGTHQKQDEVIYFLSGSGSAFAGDAKIRIRPGAMMYVPRGVRHGFTRDGAEPVTFLWITVPPGLEEQFRASGKPPSFDCSAR